MKVVIQRDDISWEYQDTLKELLNIDRLPFLIIIETVEELK